MYRFLLLITAVGVQSGVVIADVAPATQPATAPVMDRAAIEAEIKLDTDAVKSITDELAGHEKDAADAESLAKNPPAGLSEADKAAYIDKQKNQEQDAQDAADKSRERLKEAQASLDQDTVHLKELTARP